MPFIILMLLPILELVVFIQVGARIGVLWVLALIFLSIFAGFAVFRTLGTLSVMQVQQRLRNGELPLQELGQGLWLAIAGILLIVPGFITSTLGVLLLLPWSRKLLGVVFARNLPPQFKATASSGAEKDISDAVIVEHYRVTKTTTSNHSGTTLEGEFKQD